MARDRFKLDDLSLKKLAWLKQEMMSCDARKACYGFNYEGILNAFLLKNKMDMKKTWSFDEVKGEVFITPKEEKKKEVEEVEEEVEEAEEKEEVKMALTITAITPEAESNVGIVEVEISGVDFTVDAANSAELSDGVTTIPAVNFEVVSNVLIRCDFNLYGVDSGPDNLAVVGVITDTLLNAFTVTTSNNYCTYTDVKRFCLINRVNPNYNVKINNMIPRASELIELNTGRVFNVRAFVETLDNNGKQIAEDTIFPRYFPIQAVTSFTLNGNAKTENTEYWVYRTYILYNTDIICENKGLVIEYTGGTVALPQVIHQLCIEIAAIMCNLKTVTYTTDEGIDRSVILTSFPDYIQQVYNKYKKVEIW